MLKRAAFLFLVWSSFAARPVSACEKCKMQLVCQPNCEIHEVCTPNSFGERGYECQETTWGCDLSTPCYWVDLLDSSPFQTASLPISCPVPGRS